MNPSCEKVNPAGGLGRLAAGCEQTGGAVRARLALAYHEKAHVVNPLAKNLRFSSRTGEEAAGGIPLHLPDGRVAGTVIGDTLLRRARGSVHMLQKPRGWAFNESLLRQAEALGARTVRIVDTETGDVYSAPLSRFWTRGITIERGHGRQVALLLADWSRDGAPSADAMLVQLPLLEEVGV